MTTLYQSNDAATVLQEQLSRMTTQLDQLLLEAQEAREQQAAWRELTEDMAPILHAAFAAALDRFGQLDQRGYFEFATEFAGVIDRVVTGFGEEDVRALGDNVVLILEALREMTQPEVMSMVQRTAHVVAEQQDHHAEPPSLIHLLRELREPRVRQGLEQLITVLRSMGGEPPTGP